MVSHFYDPLLAKLIVHAPSREQAIARGIEAVDGFMITGVKTNLPLHRHVLDSPAFRSGDYTTAILDTIGPAPRTPAATAP
jgi:acetyl-CoA carboxylase biotin carboxylase subunit